MNEIPAPNFAQSLSLAIEKTLDAFADNAGIGPDAYAGEPQAHPMADAKCLRALAVLLAAKKISEARFVRLAGQCATRLEDFAIPSEGGGILWGLGFSWRDLSKQEPYLITSALVVRGLLAVVESGRADGRVERLFQQGLAGLGHWCGNSTVSASAPISIPQYSPGIPLPIFNAAAYALATLIQARPFAGHLGTEPWQDCLAWIVAQRTPDVGWRYSPTNPTVDLVHQAYILNAAADVYGVRSIEAACLELLGQFAVPGGMIDVVRLHDDPSHLFGRDIPALRRTGDAWLEVVQKPARLWSYGEFLVVVSRLAREGEHAPLWFKFGQKLAGWIIDRLASGEEEAVYPRHTQHALHGLACHLALMRERAQAQAEAAKEVS